MNKDAYSWIGSLFKDLTILILGIFTPFFIMLWICYQIETMPDTSHTIRKFKDIDPAEFEGFENISPDAEVCNGYCLDYSIGIKNEKGRPIHWGPFILKDNLYFYSGLISIIYLNQPAHVIKIREIKGIICRTDEWIDFHRKDPNSIGYKYSDFELYRCTLPLLDVAFGNTKYQLENIEVRFKYSKEYNDAPEEVRIHFTSQKLTEIIYKKNFRILIEDKKHRLLSNYNHLAVLDEQGNVLFVRDKLFSCDDDCFGQLSVDPVNVATTPIKLAQCEYPQRVTVYLTNFKDNYADWYFESSIDEPISTECRHHRLPYHIQKEEK